MVEFYFASFTVTCITITMAITRITSRKGSRKLLETTDDPKNHPMAGTAKCKQKQPTNTTASHGTVHLDAKAKSDTLDKMNHLLSKLTSSLSTICPSQVARGLNKDSPARYPDWRAMMEFTRSVVWEQVRTGRVQVTQGGEVRGYGQRDSLTGPIRIRRGPEWTST